jgi:hypothetical protein
MPRSLPALVLAAAAGAAVTYLLVAPPRPTAPGTPPTEDSPRGTPPPPMRAASATGVAERAAVYATAADADAADLARLARATAAEPPSSASTFKLGVLLARYAELDPKRAVALGRELRAPADVLGTLYAQWATADPAGARAALAEIEDPVAATAIGLKMFAALGNDERSLREVAAELPSGAERGFLVGALAAGAESDPARALEQALALADSGLAGLALQRIAATWAKSDVAAALSAGDGIADADLRATFQNAVVREWAQFDLDGVFAYYVGLDVQSQEELAALGAMRDIARLDPYRALELAAGLPSNLRTGVEQSALQALSSRDPESALRYASRLPPGQQHQFLRQSLARAYGKQNPDAALAWARATGVRENLFGVLAGVAVTNPQLAFEVVATLPASDRAPAVQELVRTAMSDRGTNFAALADGLLTIDGPLDTGFGPRGGFGMMLGMWASRSLTAALDWTLANGERVPPVAFANLAGSVARNDLATAERYLTQVPERARFAWLQGMAQSYAQTDPSAAANWVEQFRGEAAYPTAVAQIAQSLARLDPAAAAGVLERVDDAGTADAQALSMAAYSVGNAWARSNAVAAADWARRFATDDERARALGAVAEVWASTDYAAARSWSLRLPVGTPRDAALRPLLGAAESGNDIDASVLSAFSSDSARQNGVLGAIHRIAQRNPADARLVAERYLSTPEQRQQAERRIDDIERQQVASPVFFVN